MIKERNIVTAMLLTVLTCGLYGIYWMIQIQEDSLRVAREEGPTGVSVFLLTLVTCGLYGIYWSYTLGERVDKINGKAGNGGLLFIILQVLGFGIVNYCIAQSTINAHTNGY